jgi:hypothetical protein
MPTGGAIDKKVNVLRSQQRFERQFVLIDISTDH